MTAMGTSSGLRGERLISSERKETDMATRAEERTPLTDGGWFKLSSALAYGEMQDWDGSNHISRATGSQWDHERLFLSSHGAWILNRWSERDGALETYARISVEQAAEWIVRAHGGDLDPSELVSPSLRMTPRQAESIHATDVVIGELEV
jgi:hypothetical protein